MSKLAGLLLILFGLVLLGGVFFVDVYHRTVNIDPVETLVVDRGDTLTTVSQKLESAGAMPWSPFWFSIYTRATASAGHIKAGEYQVTADMTMVSLLDMLRSGRVVQRTITFPEGWTVSQWIDLLVKTDLLSANERAGLLQFTQPLIEWEGWLYPDTYSYTKGESAERILLRAKIRMQEVLTQVWEERPAHAVVTSKQDALVLASMIEKETGYEGDRRMISSVFNNRLRIGMKLQSDPTVIYGLPSFDGDLKRRHLRLRHDYNTYVIEALPIGAICNPGRQSLIAAVDPQASENLYFVAKGDGRSKFSKTLKEHNLAVTRYQKTGRVENYRSTPRTSSTEGY